MKFTMNIILCWLVVSFLCVYNLVESAELFIFKKDSALNDLKCDTTEALFVFVASQLAKCVTTCLQFFTCTAVFFDQSQKWCQGCSSTTTTLSATGTVAFTTDRVMERTCSDLLANGVTTSGIYSIRPKDVVLSVYCDMDTLGGGWTVFQRRFDGSMNFYRVLADYRNGFGTPSAEHWLGLKYIHRATHSNAIQEVYLEFLDSNDNVAFEHFGNFKVGIGPNHNLTLGQFINASDGNSVDGSLFENNDQPFNTYDRDFSAGCPENLHGGWWYNSCTKINPNGHYAVPGSVSSYGNGFGGMTNVPWRGNVSLKETKLMFRTYAP